MNPAEESNRSDNILARLALALDDAVAPSSEPDLNEISDWHMGLLAEPRASEVKSWVARDVACYRLWAELRAAEREASPSHRSAVRVGVITYILRLLTSLLPSIEVLRPAAAMAITLLPALVLVSHFNQSLAPAGWVEEINSAYRDWPAESTPSVQEWPIVVALNRSIEANNEQSLTSGGFMAGIHSGLLKLTAHQEEWLEVIKTLPTKRHACEGSDCDEFWRTEYEAGRWTLLVFFECVGGSRAGSANVRHRQMFERLLPFYSARPESVQKAELVSEWSEIDAEDEDLFCDYAKRFLILGAGQQQ